MQYESETLAQQMTMLCKMQAELKNMQVELKQQQKDLELQQEELRQYHYQVLRTLAAFRMLLELEQKEREE